MFNTISPEKIEEMRFLIYLHEALERVSKDKRDTFPLRNLEIPDHITRLVDHESYAINPAHRIHDPNWEGFYVCKTLYDSDDAQGYEYPGIFIDKKEDREKIIALLKGYFSQY